ncbi:quinone oxidoreductase family protein [Terrimonas pollutisoli]|uniref:quinone oxidoreductase family protein n=1 Tax=Terrimonas pollutisoli TaxID=3034147 RepID=UPI0023EC3CB8|nr:quinone oxidoreductase [Terrimonas sp. H1YJ31]
MKALTFSSFGKPDVLEYTEVNNPVLKQDEILVAMKAIGLNYADMMRRSGVYQLKGNAPYINGYEGAGIVVDNNNHKEIKIGDRIGFADVPFANAELVAVPASHAIPLPDAIDFETAAAVLLQGLSAHFLTTDCHQTKAGEIVVIHAAAGGVGQIMIQICKTLGAKVIGLVSSESKRQLTLSKGADAVFLYNENWKEKVLALYPLGVDAVFDSIGNTMEESLHVTKVRGQVVFFGMAGGEFKLGNPLYLIGTSKTITGGDLWDYLTSKEERLKRAGQLFKWIMNKDIQISEPVKFKLSDGKAAHEFMESRKSTGKILLIP